MFSCQFPGAAADGDESPWPRVAAHLQLPEVVVVSPSAVELVTDLPELLYHQEAPFADTSIFAHYALVKAAQRARQKVLLSGQEGMRSSRLSWADPRARRIARPSPGLRGRLPLVAAGRQLPVCRRCAYRSPLGITRCRRAPHQVVYSAWRRGAVPLQPGGRGALAGGSTALCSRAPRSVLFGPEAAYSAFDRYQLDGLAAIRCRISCVTTIVTAWRWASSRVPCSSTTAC